MRLERANFYLNTNTKGVIGMQRVQENPDYTAWAQPVFPGIALIHLSAHGKAACLEEAAPVSADVLEIFHCREGRMELNIGGEYCYVSPGDLLIARARKIASEVCFPLRHYHGLIVRVDVQQTPHCLSCILQDVNVQPQLIAKRFCSRRSTLLSVQIPPLSISFRKCTPFRMQ